MGVATRAQKQTVLSESSIVSSTARDDGHFPRRVGQKFRVVLLFGFGFFFFNYYYFGEAGNGFVRVGQKEGKELVQLSCIPAHFSWVWLLPTSPGVW